MTYLRKEKEINKHIKKNFTVKKSIGIISKNLQLVTNNLDKFFLKSTIYKNLHINRYKPKNKNKKK